MAEYEPLYSDRHRSPLNLPFNLWLMAAVVVTGVLIYSDSPLVIMGLVMTVYTWFVTPTTYMLFRDRLEVAYGRPRVRQVFFTDIEGVELVQLAMFSPRLRVRQGTRGDTWVAPRDAQEFYARLQDALEYHRHDPSGLGPAA